MNEEQYRLIESYLDGSISESELSRLRELLFVNAESRALLRTMATLDLGLHDIAAGSAPSAGLSSIETRSVPPERATSSLLSASWTRSLLAIATLAIIGLGSALWIQSSATSTEPAADRTIAKVNGTGGGVIWTGNGGVVSMDLKPGMMLTGGTIEGTSPTSWLELEFLDGSRFTVAGDSRLTFSDIGQKVLHLKEGSVSSSVMPQNARTPMLVFTGNARLEVLGTDFKVDSSIESTSLDVTEGVVRFKRLSDGQTVEVPANQRVQSREGLELTTRPIPAKANQWKGDFAHPRGTWGKWLPATDEMPARLKPVFYRYENPEGEVYLIRTAGMSVLGENNEQVVLQSGCNLLVRGFAKKKQKAVFGVSVRDANGSFGGYYDSGIPKQYWMELETDSGDLSGDLRPFEFVIEASKLALGPDLKKTNPHFTATPTGMVVDAIYCSAPAEDSELEITELEITPPDSSR